MSNVLKNQLRFAQSIKKNIQTKQKEKKKVESDFFSTILSNEIKAQIYESLNERDEDGYLSENTASMLTQPLDSFAMLCPTGNLIKSQLTSSKIPERSKRYVFQNSIGSLDSSQDFLNSQFSTSPQDKGGLKGSLDRLNVMWLQRKAAIERQDGDLTAALNTLQDAIDIHIGKDVTYEQANLSHDIIGDTPEDLLVHINKNYLAFDTYAHRWAARIQRWYRKRFTRKVNAVRKIKRKFLLFLDRKSRWIKMQRIIQCSILVQRKYIIRFRRRCKAAAIIKRWVKRELMRMKFRKLFLDYRCARNLQRLWRGTNGRAIAAFKRKKLNMCKMIQRNARGYICRRRRGVAIKQFHKVFYRSSLRIQCLERKIIAAKRTKTRLVQEILREIDRKSREDEVYDATLTGELEKVNLYLTTEAGKLHLAAARRKILAQDEIFERAKPTLSEKKVLRYEAKVMFEMYDRDGSGSIDRGELQDMLVDLCIPMNDAEVDALVDQLDEDLSGDIDFDEFSRWYASGGGDEASSGVGGTLFRQILRARKLVLDVSGVTIARRVKREVLRQCCAHLPTATRSLFRMTCPPKFSCCQCFETFVFFTDYRGHFEGDSYVQNCCVSGEPGLFYTRFWVQQEWMQQKACEYEAQRIRDEYPHVAHRGLLSVFAELALADDGGVQAEVEVLVTAAEKHFRAVLEQQLLPSDMYRVSLADHVMEMIRLCDDDFLLAHIVNCIGVCLNCDLPLHWVADGEVDKEEIRDWLLENIPHKSLNEKKIVKVGQHFSFSVPNCTCISKEKRFAKHIKRDATLLARVYVDVLRLVKAGTEAAQAGLAEYRKKRRRRLKIPDFELKLRNLPTFTKQSYSSVSAKLVQRLSMVRSLLRKLIVIHLTTKQMTCVESVKRMCGLTIDVPIIDDPTDEDIHKLTIYYAQTKAQAQFNKRLKSRVGQAHLKRLTSEVWAKKQAFDAEYDTELANNSINKQYKDTMSKLNYLHYLFTSTVLRDGISISDSALLFSHFFGARVPPGSDVFLLLDPQDTGFIQLDCLYAWVSSKEFKLFVDPWLVAMNALEFCWRAGTLSSTRADAEMKVVVDLRKIARMECELQQSDMKVREGGVAEVPAGVDGGGEEAATIAVDVDVAPPVAPPVIIDDKQMLRNEIKRSKAVAKINLLTSEFSNRDQSVVTTLAEDDAEQACKLSIVLSAKGRHALFDERKLLLTTQTLIAAYGETTLPLRAQSPAALSSSVYSEDSVGWSLCLKVLIYCFDTDCSGTFDESELSLLLNCVLTPLDEKRLLFRFPEILKDSVQVGQVLNFILFKAYWNKSVLNLCGMKVDVGVFTIPLLSASRYLLVSQARQAARARSEQTVQLARSGVLVNLDEVGGPENGESLFFRCQCLVMRQVGSFWGTAVGDYHLAINKVNVERYWDDLTMGKPNKISLIFYAFRLHTMPSVFSRGMLNTELPHFIRYCRKHFEWSIVNMNPKISADISNIVNRKQIYWILETDMINIVDSIFGESANKVNWSLKLKYSRTLFNNHHRDAKLHMLSVARQQAVCIAFGLPDVDVRESNARCFFLGLKLFMDHASSLGASKDVDWTNIPKEASDIYLISKGYTHRDLMGLIDVDTPDSCSVLIPYCSSGIDKADPTQILDHANSKIYSKLSCVQSIGRLFLCVVGINKYRQYCDVVKAICLNQENVQDAGLLYLNELILGTSHCSALLDEGN